MPVVVIQSDGAVDIGHGDFSTRLMARDVLRILNGLCVDYVSPETCEKVRRVLRGVYGKIGVIKVIGLTASRVEKVVCDSVEAYCDGTVKFACVKEGKKLHLMTTLSWC